MADRPLIGLALMMRDEEQVLPALLPVTNLIDTWTIVDTGSSDASIEVARQLMHGIPGELHERPWVNFGANYTETLELARGSADWLLLMDADQRPEVYPPLRDWLAGNPEPDVDAFMVEVEEAGTTWRLPLLLRGDQSWKMVGPTHEYLELDGKRTRPLLGLTLHNLRPGGGSNPTARFESNLRLLEPGVKAGDPRAIFYTAESLKDLGRSKEAAGMYERRARIKVFEEEAWYAAFQAARLREDKQGLLRAWRRRPWRHEPLTELARLVASEPNGDVLFRQQLTTTQITTLKECQDAEAHTTAHEPTPART